MDFVYIGDGRNRSVWRHGNYVIKIPLNDYGLSDNQYERQTFLRAQACVEGSWIQYARCRLIGGILVMQYAQFQGPLSDERGFIPYNQLPEWADFVDCQQVGYNRFGKIVAYDYGIH